MQLRVTFHIFEVVYSVNFVITYTFSYCVPICWFIKAIRVCDTVLLKVYDSRAQTVYPNYTEH